MFEKAEKPDGSDISCGTHVMRDFVGLDLKDKTVIQSMMKFTACCTEGNMDEAFKAIKQIKRLLLYVTIFGRINVHSLHI